MQPPTHALVTFLFGAQAELILPSLPERLRRWDAAFDEWLRISHQNSPRMMVNRYKAWRSLLRFAPRPPWEIGPVDVQAWIDHLADDRGYTPRSLATLLSILRSFYHFAQDQAIESPPPADPVDQVAAPFITLWPPLYSLSEAELAAFIAAIDRHASPLAMRNYAMILLIVHCGLSPREVRLLRWADLAADWQNSRLSLERANLNTPLKIDLPPEVVAAIHDYLHAAGRLENIQPAEILFPGATEWYSKNGPHTPKSWNSSQPMQVCAFVQIVHTIAARAGLQAERVTPTVIRNTALARRIQLGDDIPALLRFCGFQGRTALYHLRKRIINQPQDVLWKTESARRAAVGEPPRLYAGAIPPEDLKLLESTQPSCLQDEIDALRLTLMRTLRQAQNASGSRGPTAAEQIRLLDSYSAAAARLASLLKAQKELEQAGDDFDLRLEQALKQAQADNGWELGVS